jgi:hypothetical protein
MSKQLSGFLAAVCIVPLLAASAQALDVLASRRGADDGAKPCRYETQPRPSVLVTPERLALVRKEILSGQGERPRLYARHVKSNADRWLRRAIAIPEVGGWGHDFFCADGTRLELPPDQLFDPNLPSRCPVCGKTCAGEKVAAARLFFEHNWLAGAVRDLALAYALEGRPEYARQAAEILTHYADAYPRRLGGAQGGGFQSSSLAEAVDLIPMAEGYDLIYDALTPGQRTHIERDLFWPAAQSLTQSGLAGNWGSWHLSAVGVIGYATRHQRFIDYAIASFKMQISDVLGDDGLWPESVGTYHFYPLDGLLAFTEAAAHFGDDLYAWEAKPGKSLKSMFTAPLRYAYPNLRLAAINDGWYDSFLPQDQYTLAWYRYRETEFAWAAREIQRGGKSGVPGDQFDQHYRNLLYGESPPARLEKPVFISRDFPGLGIAILRQGTALPASREMMLTFHYGPFLAHGHLDKMSVTLFGQGRLLAPDYGTSGYGAEISRFLQSTPAHNTVIIDGRNQPHTQDRNLTSFQDRPEFKLASATTTEVEPGTTWTRTVMLTDQYAVIWDSLEGAAEHQYDWFFHAEGESLSLNGIAASTGATNLTANEFPYQFIAGPRRHELAGASATAQWRSNAAGLGLWLLNRPGQTAYTAQLPTPEAKQVPLLVLRQKGRRAEFLALLWPWKGKDRAQPAQVRVTRDDSGSLRLTVPAGSRTDQLTLDGHEVVYQKAGQQPLTIPTSKP